MNNLNFENYARPKVSGSQEGNFTGNKPAYIRPTEGQVVAPTKHKNSIKTGAWSLSKRKILSLIKERPVTSKEIMAITGYNRTLIYNMFYELRLSGNNIVHRRGHYHLGPPIISSDDISGLKRDMMACLHKFIVKISERKR